MGTWGLISRFRGQVDGLRPVVGRSHLWFSLGESASLSVVPEQRSAVSADRPRARHAAERGTAPDHIDEEVEARLEGCPDCGGDVDVEQPVQLVVDLPAVRAHIVKILTEPAWCRCCRRRVRNSKPIPRVALDVARPGLVRAST